MADDPYKILDVPKDADGDQIKRAHRRKAKEHHPDAHGERDDFERVQRAYLVLADPERRAKYDRTGTMDDAVENPLAVLVDYVMQAFDIAVEVNSGSFERMDMIAETRKVMREQLTEMHHQLKGIRANKTRAERLLRRLKFKGEGMDPIGNSLRQRVGCYEEEVAKGEREIAEFNAAIAYLDHYGFDFDAPVMSTMQHGGVTFHFRS